MSYKNTIISSLRTVISTILLILANIAAVIAVDYVSTDFTVGPLYNVLLIIIAFTVANAILWPIFRRFLMKYITDFWNRGNLSQLPDILHCNILHSRSLRWILRLLAGPDCHGNIHHIHDKHHKHKLL